MLICMSLRGEIERARRQHHHQIQGKAALRQIDQLD